MFWESEKQQLENEKTVAPHAKLVEILGNRKTLVRFLWLCCGLNSAIWIAIFIVPYDIYSLFGSLLDVNDKLAAVVFGIPFGLGMYFAYCVMRLKFPDVEDNRDLQPDVMATFAYQTSSNKRYFIWIAAIVAEILNAFLMVLFDLFLVG